MSGLQIFIHFSAGLITSFLGSIPLGAINATTARISITKNLSAAILFILGATIAELFYSCIAVHFSGFLLSFPRLEFYLQLLSIPIFIFIGISYWQTKTTSQKPSGTKENSFLQGLSIGFLNPLQIPFWLAYTTYFLSVGWIQKDVTLLNIFILGIISGSFLLLYLIAKFASIYSQRITITDQRINKITALIFFLLALYQFGKIVWGYL